VDPAPTARPDGSAADARGRPGLAEPLRGYRHLSRPLYRPSRPRVVHSRSHQAPRNGSTSSSWRANGPAAPMPHRQVSQAARRERSRQRLIRSRMPIASTPCHSEGPARRGPGAFPMGRSRRTGPAVAGTATAGPQPWWFTRPDRRRHK
jgi:hypothetical protein